MSRRDNKNRLHIRGDRCLYCGLPATTEDHFPPASYAKSGLLLPACRECNNLAGTEYPISLIDRSLHVKSRIRKRNLRFIRHIEWSDEELADLSELLQREYRAWREKKAEVNERLAWNAMGYFALIVRSKDFARLSASLNSSLESEQTWFEELKENFQKEAASE
jgi:hypothetical protein